LIAICFAFQLHESFIGGQDSVSVYLPMSRFAANHHSFLTDWRDNPDPDAIALWSSYPPLLYGLGATLFLASGMQNEKVTAVIPVFLFLFFLICLFRWSEDDNRPVNLLALLLISSPVFIERFSWFFQECLLVFSTTLLFYMLWKYSKERQDIYIKYAMIASSLGLMSKYTGIFFTIFLAVFLIYNKRFDRKIVPSLIITHLLPAMWYIRNVWYFGNPFSFQAATNFLTLYPSVKESAAFLADIYKGYGFLTPFNFALAFILLTWLPLWIILRIFSERRFLRYDKTNFYRAGKISLEAF